MVRYWTKVAMSPRKPQGRRASVSKDRRVHRTRRALREALIELLRRKSFDDITVDEIAAEADVGRSTFYAHCSGKEDLLRRGLQNLRTELAEASDRLRHRSGRIFGFSLGVLEHVAQHRATYPGLGRSRGRDVLLRELRQTVLELLREDLERTSIDRALPRELVEQCVTGAYMALLTWYLEQKPPHAPAELDEWFQHLVLRGIAPR
jgi:AcrR family transcriptional regulator